MGSYVVASFSYSLARFIARVFVSVHGIPSTIMNVARFVLAEYGRVAVQDLPAKAYFCGCVGCPQRQVFGFGEECIMTWGQSKILLFKCFWAFL